MLGLTEKDLKFSKAKTLSMKAGLKMASVMDMAEQFRARVRFIKDSSKKTPCMAKVSSIGQTVAFTRATGRTIKSMVRENISGQMDKFTMGCSRKTTAQVTESFTTPMENVLKVIGKKGRSMVLAPTFTLTLPISKWFTGMARSRPVASS
jgi:hypothetical protein